MGGVNMISIYRDQMQFVSVGQERSITWWDLREVHPLRVQSDAHGASQCARCIAISHRGGAAG